jgi:hypothetical protein
VAEIPRQSYPEPPGAFPPPFPRLRSDSRGRSPASEFVGYSSPFSANSGDPRPPEAMSALSLATSPPRTGVALVTEPLTPCAPDRNRSLIQRARSLDTGSRTRYALGPHLLVACVPWRWARSVSLLPQSLTSLACLSAHIRAPAHALTLRSNLGSRSVIGWLRAPDTPLAGYFVKETPIS